MDGRTDERRTWCCALRVVDTSRAVPQEDTHGPILTRESVSVLVADFYSPRPTSLIHLITSSVLNEMPDLAHRQEQ